MSLGCTSLMGSGLHTVHRSESASLLSGGESGSSNTSRGSVGAEPGKLGNNH